MANGTNTTVRIYNRKGFRTTMIVLGTIIVTLLILWLGGKWFWNDKLEATVAQATDVNPIVNAINKANTDAQKRSEDSEKKADDRNANLARDLKQTISDDRKAATTQLSSDLTALGTKLSGKIDEIKPPDPSKVNVVVAFSPDASGGSKTLPTSTTKPTTTVSNGEVLVDVLTIGANGKPDGRFVGICENKITQYNGYWEFDAPGQPDISVKKIVKSKPYKISDANPRVTYTIKCANGDRVGSGLKREIIYWTEPQEGGRSYVFAKNKDGRFELTEGEFRCSNGDWISPVMIATDDHDDSNAPAQTHIPPSAPVPSPAGDPNTSGGGLTPTLPR